MHQPAAIWSSALVVFDKEINLTQNVILVQGRSALRATIDRIDRLHEITHEGPIVNAGIHPDIAPTLSDLCYQAGLASTILFNDAKRGPRESPEAYKLRQERAEYVKHWCSEQNFQPTTLLDREVRNSLTHIDERLADILTREPYVGWFLDVAVRNRHEFSAPDGISVQYCRSYVTEEDCILHLTQELSLAHLRAECAAVLAIVFGVDYGRKSRE